MKRALLVVSLAAACLATGYFVGRKHGGPSVKIELFGGGPPAPAAASGWADYVYPGSRVPFTVEGSRVEVEGRERVYGLAGAYATSDSYEKVVAHYNGKFGHGVDPSAASVSGGGGGSGADAAFAIADSAKSDRTTPRGARVACYGERNGCVPHDRRRHRGPGGRRDAHPPAARRGRVQTPRGDGPDPPGSGRGFARAIAVTPPKIAAAATSASQPGRSPRTGIARTVVTTGWRKT